MGVSNHLLDFDTSLFRTSSRQLRRLFFRRPVPFSFLSSGRKRRAPEFSSRCRRCETDSRRD